MRRAFLRILGTRKLERERKIDKARSGNENAFYAGYLKLSWVCTLLFPYDWTWRLKVRSAFVTLLAWSIFLPLNPEPFKIQHESISTDDNISDTNLRARSLVGCLSCAQKFKMKKEQFISGLAEWCHYSPAKPYLKLKRTENRKKNFCFRLT